MKIEQITPYEHNNRLHNEQQIERIARSIEEFGFNQPIVVDEDGVIIIGHGRLLAAQKLGIDDVPVKVAEGLSEEQKRAYRILDNKLQNDSEWDFESLEIELGYLEEQNFDLEGWGLDDLKVAFTENDEVEEDQGPCEPNPEPWVQAGDIIDLGRHLVICGDARDLDLEDPCQMLITDPPYGVDYVGKTKKALKIENDNLTTEQLEALWRTTSERALEQLVSGAAMYATVPAGPLNAVFTQVWVELEVLHQVLTWVKDSLVLGRSDYHYRHEPILYGWKPGAAHNFYGGRSKTSVLEFDRPKASREHPTMKPIELWAEMIRNSSRRGDRILDIFGGSGTTLIAADKMDRTAVLVELKPEYCQVIVERYCGHREQNGKEVKIKVNGEEIDPEQVKRAAAA